MKEIFQKEFKKQEQNVLNVLDDNFGFTMSEIKRSKEEMSELKKILNVTDNVFEKKLKN